MAVGKCRTLSAHRGRKVQVTPCIEFPRAAFNLSPNKQRSENRRRRGACMWRPWDRFMTIAAKDGAMRQTAKGAHWEGPGNRARTRSKGPGLCPAPPARLPSQDYSKGGPEEAEEDQRAALIGEDEDQNRREQP